MIPNPLPRIVSQAEWQTALGAHRAREKAATRVRDALAAERRRLPMVKIEKDYRFEGESGPARLADLFEGRRQLIVYHVMFGPTWRQGCVGCSMSVDNIGHLSHLHARDVSMALVSRAPLAKLAAYKKRMGWTVPWYSSFDSDFNFDFGATVGEDEKSSVSVFLRDVDGGGDNVYRTYATSGRGDEMLGTAWSYLDLVPFGRQETWEDSPQGWPQTPPYDWWQRHDEYDDKPALTSTGA
ncbi:MAG: DUF899 domain-containing protein [Reyranella sp.]|nr:DUF899 domain-containing protein [Reyranella sp.]MDP3158554.1 DUF899 domain-containing protein [Reyranella sp.]